MCVYLSHQVEFILNENRTEFVTIINGTYVVNDTMLKEGGKQYTPQMLWTLFNFFLSAGKYTAKLLMAVRRGSVDVPTQYRHASDPHRRSKKHELRLTQYR